MSDESANPLIEALTGREFDILSLLAEDKTNREIAETLVLSVNTVKWYVRQIYGKLGVGDRQAAVRRALSLGLLSAEQMEAMPEHNLPAQLTPFVGREKELAELEQQLLDPAVRLITVLGPGGMGKTRLALQTATALLTGKRELVRDGLYFVSLTAVDETQGITQALAEILGLTPVAGETDTGGRLRRYLREKQLLLLLDNVEHLVGQDLAGWLEGLLAAAGGVTMLVTSRQRLNVRGEYLHWMKGLQLPPPDIEGQQPERLLEASSALTLFLQTARRVQPGFALTTENYPAVSEICRLTEGMPLGIELASAWMGLLTSAELLDELRQTPDILATETGNVPPGQRSLRAVFDTSWRLLAQPERQALRALAYFRGGFTRQAAEAVCDVSLVALLSLVNKCWLRRGEGGRFSMHELLRQYGVEALAAHSEQHTEIQRRHSAYYCDWLAAKEEAIHRPQQAAAQAEVSRELGNIRLASLAAIETGQLSHLARAVHVLGLYYRWHGGYLAGDNFLERLLRELDDAVGGSQAGQLARTRLLVWRADLKGLLGHRRSSQALVSEASVLLEQLEAGGEVMDFERMYIAITIGYHYLHRDRNPQLALHHFSVAHELAKRVESQWEKANTLIDLARARRNLGELEKAERIAMQGIALIRESGTALAVADAVTLHGNILLRMGRLEEAESLLLEDFQLTASNPDVGGLRLLNLAWVRYLLGQFSQAEALANQAATVYREAEIVRGQEWARKLESVIILHQGRYAAAFDTIKELLTATRLSWKQEVRAFELYLGGARALVAGDWDVAGNYLRQSLAIRTPTRDLHNRFPHALRVLVARGTGLEEDAQRYLAAEVQMTLASHAFPALMLTLLVGALLLADRGEGERATEVYTRVWQEPFAHNSVWLREVAGQELEEIAARLPAGNRAAAEERGRSLDLWETAAALLGEFDDLANRSSSAPDAGE